MDGSIAGVTTAGAKTTVTVRQDGQMPSPVVLQGGARRRRARPMKPMANAKMVDDKTAIVTWPVDVWFNGSRTFQAALDFGGRAITKITLDPGCRFPDRDPSDNVWPKPASTDDAGGATGIRRPRRLRDLISRGVTTKTGDKEIRRILFKRGFS